MDYWIEDVTRFADLLILSKIELLKSGLTLVITQKIIQRIYYFTSIQIQKRDVKAVVDMLNIEFISSTSALDISENTHAVSRSYAQLQDYKF